MQPQDSRLGRAAQAVKKLIPGSLWRVLSAPYWWWYNRARHRLAGALSARRRQSVRRLEQLKGRHRGERCFIMGNGPSLAEMDLSPLKDEFTFGMNRIYLMFPELEWQPNYFVSVNTLVIQQCAADIRRLTMPKFITWRGRRWLSDDPNVIFLDTDYTDPPTFSRNVTGRVYEGSTVTYVALQLAFHMGFEEVILIGVDHSFQAQGDPNTTVTSEGDDPDHFAPGYFGEGFRWQLPDLEASERAYRMARDAYQAAGRRVLDATVGGQLEIFPKIDYRRLFES